MTLIIRGNIISDNNKNMDKFSNEVFVLFREIEPIIIIIPEHNKHHPANLFALYQIISFDNVFFVLKPYELFGLILFKINGIAINTNNAPVIIVVR